MSRLEALLRLALAFALGAVGRWSGRPLALVLVYHRVGDPQDDKRSHLTAALGTHLFEGQVRHLRAHYRPVRASEVIDAAHARRRGERIPVAVTFDDDLPSHVRIAAPIMHRLGVPTTFFLSGASLEGPFAFWWERLQNVVDQRLASEEELTAELSLASSARNGGGVRGIAAEIEAMPRDRREAAAGYLLDRLGQDPSDSGLRAEDVRTLTANGFEIGFHTRRHEALTQLPDELLEEAMSAGREELEGIVGRELRLISYPHGKADARVASAAGEAGFRLGFASSPEPVTEQTDPLLIGRLYPSYDSVGHLALEMAQALRPRGARKRRAKAMPRNTLIRRVDWRFLVGMPEPRRAYCATSGSLRAGTRAIAGELVDARSVGECDLAVLRNPGSSQLARAEGAMAPGGALYAEWWRPLPGGAAAARRRLEAAGFEQVSCYWPWPFPGRRTPRAWLPIEAPEAVAWFLESRARPDGLLGWLRVAALHWLWWSALRTGLLTPICATARKAPADSDDRTLHSIVSARNGTPGRKIGGASGCLLLTPGSHPRNKLIVLAFGTGRGEPRVALKLPRIPESEAFLAREAAALRAVHSSGAQRGIPRLIERTKIAGRVALAESVVTGRPVLELLNRSTHRELCLSVARFLADLASGERPRRSMDWAERVAEPATMALLPPQRERARAALGRVGPLPEVCEQRDCSPWNVLIQADGEVAMLDWESAEPRGVPGLDLQYFLTYASLFADRTVDTDDWIESYRRMLDPSTSSGRVYAECVALYADRLGVEQSALERLRLLCWLVHARSAQIRDEKEGIDGSRSDSLFLELAMHELASGPNDQGGAA